MTCEHCGTECNGGFECPGKKLPPIDTAECTNYAPRDHVGHWREWHRGHGCNLDPELKDKKLAM